MVQIFKHYLGYYEFKVILSRRFYVLFQHVSVGTCINTQWHKVLSTMQNAKDRKMTRTTAMKACHNLEITDFKVLNDRWIILNNQEKLESINRMGFKMYRSSKRPADLRCAWKSPFVIMTSVLPHRPLNFPRKVSTLFSTTTCILYDDKTWCQCPKNFNLNR